MAEKIVQTAGREALGDFAPEFAHYNDDVLFGENWNNQDIDVKTRCMLTVTATSRSNSSNHRCLAGFRECHKNEITL